MALINQDAPARERSHVNAGEQSEPEADSALNLFYGDLAYNQAIRPPMLKSRGAT